MFHRGQRIIIKSSSAKKRAHPNVGDIGYLGSAFLFYKNRFILIDGEFFSYPGYEDGERKSERKRFIVDLGINSSLQRKMKLEGLPREWFLTNTCVTNLNPVHIDVDGGIWRENPNISTVWPTIYELCMSSAKHMNNLKRKVKIPIGQISLFGQCKHRVGKYGVNDIESWVRIMSPFLDVSYRAGSRIGTLDDVWLRMYKLYESIRSFVILEKEYVNSRQYFFKLSPKAAELRSCHTAVVKALKQIQAIVEMQWFKKDQYIIDRLIASNVRSILRDTIQKKGIGELINGNIRSTDSGTLWSMVAAILFRALIIQGNTYNRLSLLRDVFPFSDDWYKKKSAQIDEMKEESVSHSAALDRIFDGTLIS